MKITKERSAQIRLDLLDSTAAEISRVGFASITMAQIAANCDVAVSTITNRFRDKFELIEALVAELIEPGLGFQLDEQSQAFWSGDPDLPIFNFEAMGVITELALAAIHTSQLRPIVGNFLTSRSEAAAAFRDEAIVNGHARQGLDPSGQLQFQLATVMGHYIATLTAPEPPDVLDQIFTLIRLTLLDVPLDAPLPSYTPRKFPQPDELPGLENPLDEVGRNLVESARTTFSAHGYEGSNLQEIARITGYTTGSIYARFDGKADLMRALILESLGPTSLSTFSAWRDLIDSLGRLDESSLGAYVDRLNADTLAEERALRLVARTAARREPAIAEIVRPLQDIHMALLTDVLSAQITSGILRSDLNPEALAWWCVSFPAAIALLSDVFPTDERIDWMSIFSVTTRALLTQPG